MKQIQVTLFDKSNKYRPISTLINVESIEEYNNNKQQYLKKAITNICYQRRTSFQDLKKDGYTEIKTRVYDKEEIERQKKELHKANLIKYIERKAREKQEKAKEEEKKQQEN